MAKFYGIGVGVGHERNVTKYAIDTFSALDILYAPTAKEGRQYSVAHGIVKNYLPDALEIRTRHFPMTYDTKELQRVWDDISFEIIEEVKKGKNVGFITIGDSLTYSTYIYLLKQVRKEVEVETLPGITSFLDIASNCNFPLVEGDDTLVVVSATAGIEKIRNYLKNENSIVLMKVFRNYGEIAEVIEEEGLLPYAIAVSNSSKKEQEVFYPVLKEDEERISYFTTILINKNYEYDSKEAN